MENWHHFHLTRPVLEIHYANYLNDQNFWYRRRHILVLRHRLLCRMLHLNFGIVPVACCDPDCCLLLCVFIYIYILQLYICMFVCMNKFGVKMRMHKIFSILITKQIYNEHITNLTSSIPYLQGDITNRPGMWISNGYMFG